MQANVVMKELLAECTDPRFAAEFIQKSHFEIFFLLRAMFCDLQPFNKFVLKAMFSIFARYVDSPRLIFFLHAVKNISQTSYQEKDWLGCSHFSIRI